jgi:hypothetical protein
MEVPASSFMTPNLGLAGLQALIPKASFRLKCRQKSDWNFSTGGIKCTYLIEETRILLTEA